MKVQNHSCVTICQKKKIFHKETETEYESLCVMFTALNGLVLHSCDDNSDSASMRSTFTQFSMLSSSSLSLLSVSRTVNWDVIIFHWLIINNTCLSLLCWRIKGFLVTAQHSSAQLHCCLIISTLESAEAASQCCSTTLGLTLPANTNQALCLTPYYNIPILLHALLPPTPYFLMISSDLPWPLPCYSHRWNTKERRQCCNWIFLMFIIRSNWPSCVDLDSPSSASVSSENNVLLQSRSFNTNQIFCLIVCYIGTSEKYDLDMTSSLWNNSCVLLSILFYCLNLTDFFHRNLLDNFL